LPLKGQIIGIKISGDTCSSLSLALQAEGTSSSPYFFWHFGDPASGINDTLTITGTSPSPFPTHTFSSPGIYTICVVFEEPGLPIDTVCRTISIGLCCNGLINCTDSCLQQALPFSFITSANVSSIQWDFNDQASGSNNQSSLLNPTHFFTSVGSYLVKATAQATCGNFTDSLWVNVVNCNQAPCTGLIISPDTCEQTPIGFQVVSAYPILSTQWDFGDPSSGNNNNAIGQSATHVFNNSQLYTIRAFVQLNCGLDTLEIIKKINACPSINNSICPLFIPTAFSPNKDNVNDEFTVKTSCTFKEYSLNIYNRWGQLIFNSQNPVISWDGTLNGQDCPIGVYFYYVRYQPDNQSVYLKKGDVLLVR
jgi:gliding motility-associated-like protein